MWHNKDNEDGDYNDYSEQQERKKFLAESKQIMEGNQEFINQKLIEQGYDPERLAHEGVEFLRYLLHTHTKQDDQTN